MKIVYQYGCINDFIGIDDESENNFTDEQREEYFEKIIDYLRAHFKEMPKGGGWFNYFLQWVTDNFGEHTISDKPCECCGDYTYSQTLEIDQDLEN